MLRSDSKLMKQSQNTQTQSEIATDGCITRQLTSSSSSFCAVLHSVGYLDLLPSRFQVSDVVCMAFSLCNHDVILSSIFSLCLPLLRFPSIFPVVTKYSFFLSSHVQRTLPASSLFYRLMTSLLLPFPGLLH